MKHDKSDGEGDLDGVLDLNFVPDWARKPPEPTRWADERPSRGDRGRDRFRGEGRGNRRRDDRGRRDGGQRRMRRPREDKRDVRGRDRNARPPVGAGAGAPPSSREPFSPQRQEHRTERRPSRDYRRPPAPRLPLDIRIIPDQKGVQAVARRIHHSWMAYPIMDLATIFLKRPELTHVRIEVERDAHDLFLFQCKTCGAVARDEERALSHILSSHLEEYYEKEEKIGDPPSGSFVCVARCGVSGELLGPPNHHSYTERVQDVHDRRCPGMDMESYRRRIETVRDEEAIEQWKDEARKQTVYRKKKTAPETEPRELDQSQAIREFKDEIAGTLIRRTRKASVPAPVALYMEDVQVRSIIRRLWEEEERFPLKVSFALRAAFKHMHLHVFKAGKGIHFVTRVEPDALDAEHVVEGIREVLIYLQDNPGVSRAQLLEGLRPGIAMDSEAAHEVLSPLSWLIERGHIIEFFNGTLSVPLHKAAPRPHKPRHRKSKRKGKRDA